MKSETNMYGSRESHSPQSSEHQRVTSEHADGLFRIVRGQHASDIMDRHVDMSRYGSDEAYTADMFTTYEDRMNGVQKATEELFRHTHTEAESISTMGVYEAKNALQETSVGAFARDSEDAMPAQERKAYIRDRITRNRFSPNDTAEDNETMIMAALDSAVLDELSGTFYATQLETQAVRDSRIRNVLDMASSEDSREAMQLWLDATIWKASFKAKPAANVGLSWDKSAPSSEMATIASSLWAYEAMVTASKGITIAERLETHESQARAKYSGFGESIFDYMHIDSPGATTDTVQATPEAVHQYKEAEEVLDKTLPKLGKNFQWLRDDIAGVQTLIGDVKKLRELSDEKGTTLSSRDILVYYHKKASGIEPTKEDIESYHVLQALLNGDNKGELPF